MKKRHFRTGFALLLVAVVGMIAWLTLGQREPVYQGKDLNEWLHCYDGGLDPALRKDVDEAVQRMGTNAIPVLLRRIRTTDSALREDLFALARMQRVLKVANFSVRGRRMEG